MLTGEFVKKAVLRHKKEVPQIDHLHIAQAVVLLLQHFSRQSSYSVHRNTGSENYVITLSSDMYFGLADFG